MQHPKATTFAGRHLDMHSPDTATQWSTRGGRVSRTVSWGHRRETNTVKWGVDRSTSGGKSSLAWALGRQVFFPAAFLEIITVLRFVLHFEGCGLQGFAVCGWALGHQDFFPAAFIKVIIAVLRPVLHFEGFQCDHYLGGGAQKVTFCLDVWGCSRSAAPEIFTFSHLADAFIQSDKSEDMSTLLLV